MVEESKVQAKAPIVSTTEQSLTRTVERLRNDKNAVRRARSAGQLADFLRTMSGEFGDVRTEALTELRDAGWSLADMSVEFGIARARLSQIINRETYREYRRDVLRRR